MFKFSLSKIFTRTVEDDLEKISLSRNKNIFSDTFPKEVLINIVSFMELGTIYSFSRTDRYLLKLLFDQTPERIDKLNKLRKSHKKSQLDFLTTKNAVEEYEKEEHSQQQFELIQKLIWKPLVCYYFPKFEKTLNVKNWLHILRRRVSHIQIHARELLPLSEIFVVLPTALRLIQRCCQRVFPSLLKIVNLFTSVHYDLKI
ncbi:hypothetical protein FDP41_010976 [Naegleria fowleri]|uniref:F-box domain-containing protein n=1 Tax=Naegleria fowleri TaxID=5763 RepID=A0A6A5CBN4_NAEFO|nr:uncharacterized protein FDP41_010976 [Naegleria fowleri]KAF0982998.1 hypothetical protein FDP41_010976 [Naegleria fowleri]